MRAALTVALQLYAAEQVRSTNLDRFSEREDLRYSLAAVDAEAVSVLLRYRQQQCPAARF